MDEDDLTMIKSRIYMTRHRQNMISVYPLLLIVPITVKNTNISTS